MKKIQMLSLSSRSDVLVLTLCFISVTIWPKNLYFKIKSDNPKKIPMSAASMSRERIAAYLRLYLKNRRKNNSCNKGLNVVSNAAVEGP